MDPHDKVYLGDGAYAEIRHGELVLTTENGVSVQNRVVLGAREWAALEEYVALATAPREAT